MWVSSSGIVVASTLIPATVVSVGGEACATGAATALRMRLASVARTRLRRTTDRIARPPTEAAWARDEAWLGGPPSCPKSTPAQRYAVGEKPGFPLHRHCDGG